MPDWLKEPVRRECDTIADLIRAYRGIIAVPPSTQEVLDVIIAEVGTVNLSDISVLWAEGWIRSLKQERTQAPGTIRKRKGALSRVLHWAVDHRPLCLTNNPLDRLPHGYSGYTEYDVAALAARGEDAPQDRERDRRYASPVAMPSGWDLPGSAAALESPAASGGLVMPAAPPHLRGTVI